MIIEDTVLRGYGIHCPGIDCPGIGGGVWQATRVVTFQCVLLAAVCTCAAPNANAADSGPYCGIYAVYGAATAIGVQSSFQDLVDQQYVSARKGSTIADLEKAAEKLGVHATAFGGMGLASLQRARDPLILHLASFGQLGAYNHWILYLGMEDGRARTIDDKGAVHLMKISELMARWDGVGVAISREKSPLTNYGSVEMASLCWWAVLVLLSVWGTHNVCGRLKVSTARARFHHRTLFFVTAFLVLLKEANPDLGLLRNPACVNFIMAAEGHREFPELTTEGLIALKTEYPELVIFDNRYDGDMNYGHVPGARSMPVDASQQEVTEYVSGLDRRQPVVVYCQSVGCRFSDRMAVILTGFGFEDIRIYRDGWVGWKEHHRRDAASADR